MTAEAIITVSASVVACVQLLKWAFLQDKHGPIAVLVLSLIGTAFWGWTAQNVSRATAFMYFAGWISVATSAAGIFGFTRASAEAVTKTSAPPSGAGASTTVDVPDD